MEVHFTRELEKTNEPGRTPWPGCFDEHGAEAGYGEVEFEVTEAVPAERADTVALAYAEAFEQVGEAMDAPVIVGIGVAMHGTVRHTAGDFLAGKQLRRALQHVRERELVVHHQSGHGD